VGWGGGSETPLKRSVPDANHGAYRRLSGLIGFRRPLEFGLYRPRPLRERPGPLGTLQIPLISQYQLRMIRLQECSQIDVRYPLASPGDHWALTLGKKYYIASGQRLLPLPGARVMGGREVNL